MTLTIKHHLIGEVDMKWYTSDKLPPLDEEGVGDSVPVLATFDGKTIAALAIYRHSIKQWFAMAGGGELRIMGTPLKWAYPEVEEHHHCRICSKSYLTQAEATRCFLEHDENTILRHIAYEIFAAKHFAKDKSKPDVIDHEIWQLIEQLNEKFNFAEVDERGGVWNKSIRDCKIQLVEEQDLKELFSWWFSTLDDNNVDPWQDEEFVKMANKYQYTKKDSQKFLNSLC